jgi:hypothetical protein
VDDGRTGPADTGGGTPTHEVTDDNTPGGSNNPDSDDNGPNAGPYTDGESPEIQTTDVDSQDPSSGHLPSGSNCHAGQQTYTEDRVTLTVVFDKDYLRFRSRVGQALSRYMVTSRANQFAVASAPLRQYHAKLMERANEMVKGQEVPVTALIKRRTCDRRVETVEFTDVQTVPATH